MGGLAQKIGCSFRPTCESTFFVVGAPTTIDAHVPEHLVVPKQSSPVRAI